jgi:hypothetical protein
MVMISKTVSSYQTTSHNLDEKSLTSELGAEQLSPLTRSLSGLFQLPLSVALPHRLGKYAEKHPREKLCIGTFLPIIIKNTHSLSLQITTSLPNTTHYIEKSRRTSKDRAPASGQHAASGLNLGSLNTNTILSRYFQDYMKNFDLLFFT